MGIDARILIRYKGEKPTQDQLTRWSWEIGSAIGANYFFISDGLPREEYKKVTSEWHEKFNAHPLYNSYHSAKTQAERQHARDQIVADIGEFDFEERRYAIQLTSDYDDDLGGAEDGKLYVQDGPDIHAAEGEWLMEVSVWSRYYGVGYERGDLVTICAIAEWIEANIPNAEVWYGGDSSGVLAEPFGADVRNAMKRHYYSTHGRDYFKGFGGMRERTVGPAPCGLCIPGETHFNQHGFGHNFAAVSCAGCGKTFVSTDNGATWTVEKEK